MVKKYEQLFTDFDSKGEDQACIIIPSTILASHVTKGKSITFNFDKEFPFRPKVVVSLTGFSADQNAGVKSIALTLKPVTDDETYNDKFELTINTVPANYAGLNEVSFCYYAYLNFDKLFNSMGFT